MKSLQEKIWRKFRIGDLFSIRRPEARNKDDYKNGKIPFVASGAENNGVMKFCAPKSREKLDEKNCITVSPVDGSTFYQEFNFLGRGGAGSSILMLYSEENEKFSGQFIARMVANTCSKYTYGHMGNKESIKREIILLPVTNEGEPDYEYMAEYARQKREELLTKYCEYVVDRLSELGDIIKIPELEEKEWGEFNVIGDRLFRIDNPTTLKHTAKITKDGVFDVVGATSKNNGSVGFLSGEFQNLVTNGNCVCLIKTGEGSVGDAVYKYNAFIPSNNVAVIRGDFLNMFLGLFIVTTINKLSDRYNYGYIRNNKRMLKEKIMLPVTDAGNPDYEYMEQYAKNLMIKKYRQYLEYLRISGDRGSVGEETDENQYDRYVRAAAPRNGKE